MSEPRVRLVFDRRNTSTRSTSRNARKGVVEIEVYHERKRKYMSTGVHVYRDQYSDRERCYGFIGCQEMNARLQRSYDAVFRACDRVMRDKGTFTYPDMMEALESEKRPSMNDFYDFVIDQIRTRNDIRESTRRKHMMMESELKDFGQMMSFDEVTRANVTAYDRYLHSLRTITGEPLSQQTIHTHHKILKAYIHLAMAMGYVQQDPYDGMRIKVGVGKGKKYLTEEELDRIRNVVLDARLVKVRDVFLFQCYTALSYSDMAKFDFLKATLEADGRYRLIDNRVKTDEEYYIVLVEPAMEILRKYDFHLPVISNQKMNDALKLIAVAAGVDKPISTHYGRHTFCVHALNNGVPLPVISRMMGHSSTQVTQAAYARLMTKSIDDGYDVMERVFK